MRRSQHTDTDWQASSAPCSTVLHNFRRRRLPMNNGNALRASRSPSPIRPSNCFLESPTRFPLLTISLIPGERHRDTVVTPREQRLYLNHAPEPLKSIATILVETGIRPDECHRLRWEDLHWSSFGKSTLRVNKGKTPAARRVIPMSEQVHFVLETRWEAFRGLDMACGDKSRSCRSFHSQEKARPHLSHRQRSHQRTKPARTHSRQGTHSLGALLLPAYVPDATRPIGV
jgi:integrase